MHCLYNYWFCYENWKENDPQGFFRRIQIQNEKDKITKFIGAERESESEPELESDAELELKSELESDTE